MNSNVMMILMIANSLIAISYASIPVSLVVFVTRRKDIPFSWVFVLFSAFILACGTTHAMHVVSIWRQTPMGWWQAGVDSLTAVISLASAIVIWPLLPKLLSIPSPAQLQTVNYELQHEKVTLEQTQNELRRAYAEVEQRVAERTAELVRANQSLQAEIAERKRAEEALEKSRSLLTETEMLGSVGGWEFDMDTKEQTWTEEVYRIHEVDSAYKPTVDVGINFYASASRPIIEQAVQRAVEQGEPFDVELEIVTAKGNFRSIHAIGKADMEHRRVFGFFQDITERKQAEEKIRQLNASLEQRVEERTAQLRDAQEQLVRHEKLAVLGQLAGSVGHELRHPLGVISNAVYFLKASQTDAAEKVKEYLNIIEDATHISEKIVNDLLDFTRVKSADRKSLSVSQLIHQTLERYPAPASVQVELDLPADLPQIYADRQHVIQILGNLTLNAFQAMASTGLTGGLQRGKLVISSQAQGEMICIAVRDTGSGISAENMKKLFEPLFTTKPKGIGLGLAVSQNLIAANGGRIEVQSEGVPGKGSTFSVYIPIYKEAV